MWHTVKSLTCFSFFFLIVIVLEKFYIYIYIDNFGCLIITFTLTFTFIIVNYSLNCSELVGCYPKSVAKFQAPPKKVCNKCISGGIWMFEWKRLIMTLFFFFNRQNMTSTWIDWNTLISWLFSHLHHKV